jgi:hypothetical protein
MIVAGVFGQSQAQGVSDLLNQKALTPEALARQFANFTFEISDKVQEPEVFLSRKRGDCADFANLTSMILKHQGYTTKMVVVMMGKQTHVVCFVKEVGAFLDFNRRADAHPLTPSNGSLEDIAAKVAASFRSDWHMASEFRYKAGGLPVYLDSVFPIDPGFTPVGAKSAANEAGDGRMPKSSS